MIYLAAPYTHFDGEVREMRVQITAHIAAYYIEKGYPIFSPILHGHHIESEAAVSIHHSMWMKVSLEYLDVMQDMWLAPLEGWNTSKGVKMEMDHWNNKHSRGPLVLHDIHNYVPADLLNGYEEIMKTWQQ